MNTLLRGATSPICALFASNLAIGLVGCSQAADSAPSAQQSQGLSFTPPATGAVITQTNAVEANELLIYSRALDGTLAAVGQIATGGTGLGSGLSAQGAIAHEGHFLFVVNAGSSDISTFDLVTGTPVLVALTPSNGVEPVSVTAHGPSVYVLNAEGPGNIAGFLADDSGALHPVGTLPLSGANVTPTEVDFSPDGRTLIVTEKGTSLIDVYTVDPSGTARGPDTQASDGPAPFGFAFAPDGEVFVSEAENSAASAYATLGERLLSISASVANGQSAACWLAASPDGQHIFTANAGNGTLSSYRVGAWGRLELVSGVSAAMAATSHPVDMAFAGGGQYLYSLANVAGTITGFKVDGADLTRVGAVESLPASVTGLVAW